MSKEKSRKRIKIKGHYVQVRQRSTKAGKKGTIMGKWKSDKKEKKRAYRCRLSMSSRLQKFCGHSKAGSHCLKSGDRKRKCPQLVISYH